ncbi:MAG: hypothetical protein LBU24_01590 [Methanocalculaceae archaeon]|nr:hypothetical protein [Methanocalculaceae archaeon]
MEGIRPYPINCAIGIIFCHENDILAFNHNQSCVGRIDYNATTSEDGM